MTEENSARGLATNVTSSVGQMTEFNLKHDDFNAWSERFELYIMLNEINKHKKKLMFLTLLGNEGYSLMRDLCMPMKPVEKSYDDLKTLLLNYINPKPNVITERYKFKERKQLNNETIVQFVTALKKMSEYCEFAVSLDSALRDQLIWGLKDQNIKKRLLSEELLTFKKCVEMSIAMEAANNDVTRLDQREERINYQKQFKFKRKIQPKKEGRKGVENKSKIVCYCCGTPGHTKPECKYKMSICLNCKKSGHLKKVCKAKANNINSLEECDLNLSSLFKLETIKCNYVKPFVVKLYIGDKLQEFQIDTGSGVTIININDFKKLNIVNEYIIEKANISLRAYNDTIIEPVGMVSINIKYENQLEKLNIYLVKEKGPPIIGREWLIKLNIPIQTEVKFLSKFNSQEVISTFPMVFNNTLGCYKHKLVGLSLKGNYTAIFCKPRTIPFSIKDRVSKEINRLVESDLLISVETSEWGTPVVPVIKPDGSIRLCGDYKVTVNKYLEVDKYPIPRVGDLMSIFQGSTKFCSLDLCQAYQQLPLDEESQKLTTISTHKGLYMFKRLPYGLASAPGILQREMDKMLSGIPGVGCFFDDIVVAGKDEKEVGERLYCVLKKLSDAGLTVKKEKCKFFSDKITFLGYEVDKNGLHIPNERIEAITNVQVPNNIQEVKAFLGLVNYYGKFVKGMSTIAGPLYELLRKNAKFCWGDKQKESFNKIKLTIVSNNVLVHYNPEGLLVVASDASPIGIGAVLSHILPDGSEKPIAFASRTLNESERNYSQLDKEALALVFSVKYFHQFIYGREFILRTDHKPLVSIFGEKKGIPVMAAHRLQRYAIFLSGYSYKVEYVKGIDNGNADALSRLPLKRHDTINDEECDKFYINLIKTNVKSIVDLDISGEIKRDKTLHELFLRVIMGRWPDKVKNISEELKPYFNRRNELTVELGCLLWGHRLIIPKRFQSNLLQELHSTHMGTVKMKSVARSYIWWPGIDRDIENVTKSCEKCLECSENPPKAILHSWPWPEGPAQRIHLDFLGPVEGKYYIIIIDAFSKWVFVKHMINITTNMTIKVLREYFSMWGIPSKLVTDNGTSLCSEEMEKFLKMNRVIHIKTPPYNPSTNGAAENMVRTFKNYLKKCDKNTDIDTNVYKFMLSYNSTIQCSTGVSPSELHIGRKLNTSFDNLLPKAKQCYDKSLERAKMTYRGGRIKHYEVEDEIMYRNYGIGEKWIQGKITKKLSPVTYLVSNQNNNICKRHINQIIDRLSERKFVVESDDEVSEEQLQKGNMLENKVIDEKETVEEKEIEPTENNIRRSVRIRKPPNRLDL